MPYIQYSGMPYIRYDCMPYMQCNGSSCRYQVMGLRKGNTLRGMGESRTASQRRGLTFSMTWSIRKLRFSTGPASILCERGLTRRLTIVCVQQSLARLYNMYTTAMQLGAQNSTDGVHDRSMQSRRTPGKLPDHDYTAKCQALHGLLTPADSRGTNSFTTPWDVRVASEHRTHYACVFPAPCT